MTFKSTQNKTNETFHIRKNDKGIILLWIIVESRSKLFYNYNIIIIFTNSTIVIVGNCLCKYDCRLICVLHVMYFLSSLHKSKVS
jgi:hypothetical protein